MKTMKTFLILTVILFTLFSLSCKKQSESTIQTLIPIFYVDKNGNDLLDPTNQNGIKAANIDLYYIINGVKTRVLDNKMAKPENFSIDYSETNHKYCLALFVNDKYDSKNTSETLIDFGNRVDTLTTSFNILNDGYTIQEVWYNHVLKATDYNSTSTGNITITIQ